MTPKGDLFKIGAAGLLLALLLSGRGPSSAEADAPLGNDRFGLCFVSAADNLASDVRYDGALEAGAHWDRWPLYWHWVDEGGYVGPHPDGWHDYDTLVIQEIAHGITPIAILLGTADRRATAGSPDVPSPRVREKVFPRPGQVPPQGEEFSTATSPPTGLFEPIFADGTDTPSPGKGINQDNTWADFVHNTVQRYKPGGTLAVRQRWPTGVGVRYWEIWNEPDLDQFWTGTVEEYYRLLEVAYQSVKATDPEATVLVGGLAFYEKRTWLSELLSLTGGDPARAYFDVLSFHYYWAIYVGEDWMVQARAMLDAQGLSYVPIWITESGVTVWDDYPATLYQVPPESPYRATMEEQAAYVIENAALAFHHGVARNYHFMLHDDCGNALPDAFGLRQNFTPYVCNPSQGKRRPSYAAYQLAAEQFRALVPLWRNQTADQDQVAFYRPDDASRVLVLWATGGVTATATVNATGEGAQLYWIEPVYSPLGITGITRTLTLTPTHGTYTLTLPEATNQNSGIPGDTNYYIGGRPYLLVESDTSRPTSSVEPLPPISGQDFVIHWQGKDPGSGVASYDMSVSDDEGPLQPWITATSVISASFTGLAGHTYGFAVRARDHAGNEEPVPSAPQASTQVTSGVTISGPTRGELHIAYTFTASVHSPTATLPITYLWQATEQSPITQTSGLSHTVTYTWSTTGPQAITVTATNDDGLLTDTHVIAISPGHRSYLPLVLKAYAPSLPTGADLVVTSIAIDPAWPSVGQPVTLAVAVENQGTEATRSWFTVDLYVDPAAPPADCTDLGTYQGDGPPVLEPGQGDEVSFGHTFASGGDHTLYAQVDTYDGFHGNPDWGMIQESNEGNNVYGPVSGTVSMTSCVEGIANGGFESDGDWEIPVTAWPARYTEAAAHTGQRSVRVGIVEPADNVESYSSARQFVTIPTDTTGATLRFWLYPLSGEPPAGLTFSTPPQAPMTGEALVSEDAQYVLILDASGQQMEALLWQRRDDRVWTSYQFDLTAYAGQTVKLHFGVCNDGLDGVTGMYVDDVSLELCST